MEITLQDVLDARERRVMRQQTLLNTYGKPLVCFTMNIAGPEKYNAQIAKGFRIGISMLEAQLQGSRVAVLQKQVWEEMTGCEAYFVVDTSAERLKALTIQVEDSMPAGRLFDMDVLAQDGSKVGREHLGLPGRTCLICGGPVHICSRSRAHGLDELQAKTRSLLQDAIHHQEAERIGCLAVKSLLFEVCTTPKPGLVDRRNNGSHKDMDLFTFMSSSSALQPYFVKCALTGMQTKNASAAVTFDAIRFWGKQAEQTMFTATGGINTHKGAIFTLGLLCAAAGRCETTDPTEICAQVAAMTQGITKTDFTGMQTTGEVLFVRHGITGIRGQAEAGFPALLQVGLPVLEAGLARGLTPEEAGCAALLHLMCAITDTNLIARSDLATQQQVCARIRKLLQAEPFPNRNTLEKLDTEFIAATLSPGGSADLLAATYFLYDSKAGL